MDERKLEGAIEAVLFMTGKAVGVRELAKALGKPADETRKAAIRLKARYEEEGRGIRILALEDSFQMTTSQDFYDVLVSFAAQPKKPVLTEALLETLSVIAYKQPVTKPEIERIRGVNSDHAVNRLIEYKLVRELGRAALPGRPILFGTTEEFLRRFGISSKDELPEISPVKLEDFRAEAEKEAGVRVDV